MSLVKKAAVRYGKLGEFRVPQPNIEVEQDASQRSIRPSHWPRPLLKIGSRLQVY